MPGLSVGCGRARVGNREPVNAGILHGISTIYYMVYRAPGGTKRLPVFCMQGKWHVVVTCHYFFVLRPQTIKSRRPQRNFPGVIHSPASVRKQSKFCRLQRNFPGVIYPPASVRKQSKPRRPQKRFPGAGPRAYRICNTVCNDGGLRRGSSRKGRLGGDCLSERLHRVGWAGCRLRLSASRFFVRRANR